MKYVMYEYCRATFCTSVEADSAKEAWNKFHATLDRNETLVDRDDVEWALHPVDESGSVGSRIYNPNDADED